MKHFFLVQLYPMLCIPQLILMKDITTTSNIAWYGKSCDFFTIFYELINKPWIWIISIYNLFFAKCTSNGFYLKTFHLLNIISLFLLSFYKFLQFIFQSIIQISYPPGSLSITCRISFKPIYPRNLIVLSPDIVLTKSFLFGWTSYLICFCGEIHSPFPSFLWQFQIHFAH